MTDSDSDFLLRLEQIIAERLAEPSDESYTCRLVAAGVKRIAQKLGEESVELALAAMDGDRDEVLNEAADLMYHLLVLLHVQKLGFADVSETLAKRHAG